MKPGDLVVHDWDTGLGFGVVLRVDVDQEALKKNRWAVPWKYMVLWSGGGKKIHDMGTLKRVGVK